MRVIRPQTVAAIRSTDRCGLCGKPVRGVEVHHVRGRHPQIDVRLNLLAMGLFPHKCHYDGHYSGGRKFIDDCEEKVAERERCDVDDLRAVMQLLWRAPFKHPGVADTVWFDLAADEWKESAKALLWDTLLEIGVMK